MRECVILIRDGKLVPVPVYEMDELPEAVRSGKLKIKGGSNDGLQSSVSEGV